jgi:hypothetical protein
MSEWKYIAIIFLVTFIAHGIPVVYRILKNDVSKTEKEDS